MMENDNILHTETMTDYNGWVNYETWRVNLEVFDGMGAEHFMPERQLAGLDLTDPDVFAETCGDLAMHLESYGEQLTDGAHGLALSLVESFLHQVDWIEIAEKMLENYRAEK